MKKVTLLLAIAGAVVNTFGQSTVAEVEAAARARAAMRQSSLLAKLPARNIGPTQQGGRIVDIDGDPRSAKVAYLAFASGGVWKTTNNGMSFAPVFDGQGTLGIGDIAVSPANPDHIWVGTGEANSSRSSYAGMGVYLSTDAGKTWAHKGLTGTQHISRVIPHPTDPAVAWVAAMGGLYTPNADRGVFKTTDGGATWRKTLFIDDETGAIDLAVDPADPRHLLAAAWQRSRKAWEFDEDGKGSGIHASTDGGETWTPSMAGIPQGEKTGRLGIAFAPSAPKTVYALLDNQDSDPKLQREDTIGTLTARAVAKMSQAEFLAIADSNLDQYIKGKGYPSQYKAKRVKDEVKAGKYTPKQFAEYFGDANDALFNTAVKGAELYKSLDGGKNWTRCHTPPLQDVYYTYGYYFGMVRVSPTNADEVYIAGVPCLQSLDGGKTWKAVFDDDDIHVDHHSLWIDPRDGDHMWLGNDGGLYETYDHGATVRHLANMPVGQFYTVNVDLEKPYNVYGGLQDNGVQKGSSRSVAGKREDWKFLFGGDGMYVAPDPQHPEIVYTGYQFGHYYRLEKGKDADYLTPRPEIGEPGYRWNWRTPFIISPHNHEVMYMGAQYVFRSMDKGKDWQRISPDLTTDRKPQGNVPYSTISALAESPLKFGLLWAGTDDGRVHVSTDGGNAWADVGAGLPAGLWVSSISPSKFDKNTAFVCLTGYRNDDLSLHAYVTRDLGKTWASLRGDMPAEPANVLVEDPTARGLLYLGTDQGCYASLDSGAHWLAIGEVPNVACYDMVVHPREPELVVGTHGRSIYIVGLKLLREWQRRDGSRTFLFAELHDIGHSDDWGKAPNAFTPAPEPKLKLQWMNGAAARSFEFEVQDAKGKSLHRFTHDALAGYNEFEWNLQHGEKEKKAYLAPGTYSIVAKTGKEEQKLTFKVTE